MLNHTGNSLLIICSYIKALICLHLIALGLKRFSLERMTWPDLGSLIFSFLFVIVFSAYFGYCTFGDIVVLFG